MNQSQTAQSFFKNKQVTVIIMIFMLLAGFGVRMIDLKDPPLDFHPTRQLRAAIVARSIYYRLNPQADPENLNFATDPQIMKYLGRLEPPITETVVALVYTIMGEEALWVSRIVTAFFWCLGGAALALFLKNLTTWDAGLIAIGFYLFVPFGIIASRSFQPDILMIASTLWALWAFERWMTHRNWKFAVISGILSGFSLLVKPYSFFILATVYTALILVNIGLFKAVRLGQVWMILGITAVIPISFYIILQPETGNFYANGISNMIRLLQNKDFYLGWGSIADDVVSISMLLIGLAGAFLFSKKNRLIVLCLWAGYLLFGIFFSYFIYTHSYYSLMLVPIVAISLAGMAQIVAKAAAQQKQFAKTALIIIGILCMLYPVWTASKTLEKKDYFGEPPGWQIIGEAVPKNQNVIALTHDYGFPLFYYGYRQTKMWPYSSDIALRKAQNNVSENFDSLFEDLTKDQDLFLITHFADLNAQPLLQEKLANFPIYAEGPGYIIYDLR